MRLNNLNDDNAPQQNGDAVTSVDRHGTKSPTSTTESSYGSHQFPTTETSQCVMEHGLFMKKNEQVIAPLGAAAILSLPPPPPLSTESANQFPSSLKTTSVGTIKQKAARSPLRCNKNVSTDNVCPSSSRKNDESTFHQFPENHRKRFFGAVYPQGEEMKTTDAKKSCLYPASSKSLTDSSKKGIATNENDDKSLHKNVVDGQTEVFSSTRYCPDIQNSGPVRDAINGLSRIIDGSSSQLCTAPPTKAAKEIKGSVADNASFLSRAPPGKMLRVSSHPRKLRCVALKNPILTSPPKGHGNQDDNRTVPDFPLLVNFPDYVARAVGDITMDGTKHCVMCGTLCICSATSARLSCKKGESSKHNESQTKNIIPRQNKGVCTACDVAVWVVLDSKDQLEIKWCKGCKNFRPWNSFGEKRMATKCVRCRTRQKETYANQKRENSRKSSGSEWEVRTPVMT